MAFKKGMKKIEGSGRKPGTPHKKSMLVREVLENHGINLVEQILVRLPQISRDNQVKALLAMLPYAHPRLNNIEHSGEINANPYAGKSYEELKQLVLEKLKDE